MSNDAQVYAPTIITSLISGVAAYYFVIRKKAGKHVTNAALSLFMVTVIIAFVTAGLGIQWHTRLHYNYEYGDALSESCSQARLKDTGEYAVYADTEKAVSSMKEIVSLHIAVMTMLTIGLTLYMIPILAMIEPGQTKQASILLLLSLMPFVFLVTFLTQIIDLHTALQSASGSQFVTTDYTTPKNIGTYVVLNFIVVFYIAYWQWIENKNIQTYMSKSGVFVILILCLMIFQDTFYKKATAILTAIKEYTIKANAVEQYLQTKLTTDAQLTAYLQSNADNPLEPLNQMKLFGLVLQDTKFVTSTSTGSQPTNIRSVIPSDQNTVDAYNVIKNRKGSIQQTVEETYVTTKVMMYLIASLFLLIPFHMAYKLNEQNMTQYTFILGILLVVLFIAYIMYKRVGTPVKKYMNIV